MGIIRKWKVKREIKKILNSKDVEKVESINDFNKDENLENIILSIQDKGKRAQALQNAIHKIDDKEILKSIIPTLKDDDILKILEKKIEYLDNVDRNILYTTINGIDNTQKRFAEIKKFHVHLSDIELAELLDTIKDKNLNKEESENEKQTSFLKGKNSKIKNEKINIENEKIDIVTNKIIINYIKSGTLIHMGELLGCMQLDMSKVQVVEKALEVERKLQEKIEKGELPREYTKRDANGDIHKIENTIFDKEGKKLLVQKSFESFKGTKAVERRKKEVLVNLFKEDVYTYEEARNLSKTLIGNEQVEKELKESLLKIEGKKNFVKEIQAKDLIDTPITIKETGNIVEIPEEQIR